LDGVVVPRIPFETTQPIFITFCAPASAAAGRVVAHLQVRATLSAAKPAIVIAAVPIQVEIWPIVLPANDSQSMSTMFGVDAAVWTK
jgi:hypothetical protein